MNVRGMYETTVEYPLLIEDSRKPNMNMRGVYETTVEYPLLILDSRKIDKTRKYGPEHTLPVTSIRRVSPVKEPG